MKKFIIDPMDLSVEEIDDLIALANDIIKDRGTLPIHANKSIRFDIRSLIAKKEVTTTTCHTNQNVLAFMQEINRTIRRRRNDACLKIRQCIIHIKQYNFFIRFHVTPIPRFWTDDDSPVQTFVYLKN